MESKYSKENPEQSTKKQKIDEKAASEDGITKITDLSDYCLERIFDYLDIWDLLSIAESNTTFQYPAGLVFKRKYPLVYISETTCKIGGRHHPKIIEFKRLFLAFGDFISKIMLVYSNQKKNKKVLDNISKYSLRSLVGIELYSFPRGCLNKLPKLFQKVESIYLYGCDLSDESLLLSEIFPNVRFVLYSDEYKKYKSNIQIITNFPYLKTLHLRCINPNSSEFVSFIQLNSQLSECLYNSINEVVNWKLVQFIAEESQIEKFELDTYSSPAKPIHFKNLKHFVYRGDRSQFVYTFDQLKWLEMIDFNERIDNIINQNKTLVKLSVRGIPGCFEELARLPVLKFSTIGIEYYLSDEFADFINKRSSASNIELEDLIYGIEDSFKEKIDQSKWKLESTGTFGRQLQLIRK